MERFTLDIFYCSNEIWTPMMIRIGKTNGNISLSNVCLRAPIAIHSSRTVNRWNLMMMTAAMMTDGKQKRKIAERKRKKGKKKNTKGIVTISGDALAKPERKMNVLCTALVDALLRSGIVSCVRHMTGPEYIKTSAGNAQTFGRSCRETFCETNAKQRPVAYTLPHRMTKICSIPLLGLSALVLLLGYRKMKHCT